MQGISLDTVFEDNPSVTQAEAEAEVKRHHCSWSDFVADNGLKEEYPSKEVLVWLGY